MALVFKLVRGLLITVLVLISIHAFGQDRGWTAGFNVHKLGFFAPKYLSNENIRLGYWFHDYHQAGLELGVYRDARQVYPSGGFYYRFQPLSRRFRPFFEGRSKLFLVRNFVSGNELSLVWAGYAGVSFALSPKFNIEAAVGRSSIDWDQFIGFNFRF